MPPLIEILLKNYFHELVLRVHLIYDLIEMVYFYNHFIFQF